MVSTEMDMVGVSKLFHTTWVNSCYSMALCGIYLLTLIFVQNVLPQVLSEGASEDKGELARLVSL